jgi:tetratricopeptide (TPR) repeat protein
VAFESLIEDGLAALHRADFDAAAECFRRAEAEAETDAGRELAKMRLAAIDVLRNRPEADLRVFRENVMRRHSPVHVYTAAYYLTIAAVDRGDREAATRYLPVLLDATRELDEPLRTVMAYDAAAGAESIRGNHIATIEYGRVAHGAAARYEADDAPFLRATVAHNLAYNCLAASEYAGAVRYAAEAVQRAQDMGHGPMLRQALVTAAFAYLCRDRLDEATQTIDRAEPSIAGTYLEKYMHYLRGEIARRRGDLDEAARHFKRLEALYAGIPTLTGMLLSMNLAPFLLPE